MGRLIATSITKPADINMEAWVNIIARAAAQVVDRAIAAIDHRDVNPNGMPRELARARMSNPGLYYPLRKSHRGPLSRDALRRRVLSVTVFQLTKAKGEIIARSLGVCQSTVSTHLNMHVGKCFHDVFDEAVRLTKASTIKAILDPQMAPA